MLRSPTRATLVMALALGAVVTLTPPNGAAGDIATGFVRAVRHLAAPSSREGRAFSGTPPVGALFSTSAGKLNQHFCTASVVDSPAGDLVITAAHCATSTPGTLVFVPGYNRCRKPYGVWTVTKVYVDQAWNSSSSQDDDFAFLRVSQPGSSVPVEDVTGAERLDTDAPASRELVMHPLILATTWQFLAHATNFQLHLTQAIAIGPGSPPQPKFDCDGYTNGTSGGPFLSEIDPATGQGLVVGVIGGYQQGGDVPQVSYSAVLGANAAALYREAVSGG